MIDWLRNELADPHIAIGARKLPIAIRRHPRARRLTMRLAPDGSEVRITLPSWGRTRDALAFAKARESWIAQQLAKIPERRVIEPGALIPFRGEELQVDWQRGAKRMPVREGHQLCFGGPETGLEARLRRWLEREALAMCGADLTEYCERAGEPVPALRLSRAQRRWGSCASQAGDATTIRINWRLIMAPDFVRRSVVAHEVAHLRHFDHSPQFHALLGELYEGDIAAADRWLKQDGRSLYAVFS